METNNNLTFFKGGQSGTWKVLSLNAIKGNPIDTVSHLEIVNTNQLPDTKSYEWLLRGFSSNIRYTNREEKIQLDQTPSVLGKPDYKYAALIPIQKSPEWWLMTQDERRKIFEEQSRHINYSLQYLPIISRKLYHARDIGEEFDFLTWFEFAPEHFTQFDELVKYLRTTDEWKYVIREIDIRLVREN